MTLPNVLFLNDGYRSLWMFGLDALWKFSAITLIEAAIFYLLQKKAISLWRSIELSAVVNLASAAIGYVILLILPRSIGMIGFVIGNLYILMTIGYVLAFLQSWLYEYLIFRLIRKDLPIRKLGRSVAYANIASYFVMFIITSIIAFLVKCSMYPH